MDAGKGIDVQDMLSKEFPDGFVRMHSHILSAIGAYKPSAREHLVNAAVVDTVKNLFMEATSAAEIKGLPRTRSRHFPRLNVEVVQKAIYKAPFDFCREKMCVEACLTDAVAEGTCEYKGACEITVLWTVRHGTLLAWTNESPIKEMSCSMLGERLEHFKEWWLAALGDIQDQGELFFDEADSLWRLAFKDDHRSWPATKALEYPEFRKELKGRRWLASLTQVDKMILEGM